jgi:G3E family GTPase
MPEKGSRLVSANIVTGFLGSGKTTLLKSALKKGLDHRKVALIVNDFGEIGIDGTVLQGINVDRMIELPSGCICCTVGSRFALAVQEITDTVQPHLIVIETSGAADPGNLISELRLIGVKVDSVIATVDVEQIGRFCKENKTAIRQIEEADFIVMNKIDLISAEALRSVEKQLRRLNPRAPIFPALYGEVKEEILFATSVRRFWKGSREPARATEDHLREDQLTSFSFKKEGVMNRRKFERFLKRLPEKVYRAKGIVKFNEEGWSSLFNYTCGRSRIDWLSPAEGERFANRAVVIGKDLGALKERILRDLEKCMEP